MEWKAAGRQCVAVVAPGEPNIGEAERLVRLALEEEGQASWGSMEIELYPGGDTCLIIAHRADGQRVYISKWAARYLAEKFDV